MEFKADDLGCRALGPIVPIHPWLRLVGLQASCGGSVGMFHL